MCRLEVSVCEGMTCNVKFLLTVENPDWHTLNEVEKSSGLIAYIQRTTSPLPDYLSQLFSFM